MWKWIKRRELIARQVTTSDAPAAERHTGRAPGRPTKVSSKYASLHGYLANRYADMVVLTFAQIEDILGFSLPVPAWVERDWWGCRQSAACTLAGRRAMVNLAARSVTFEREVAASSGAC